MPTPPVMSMSSEEYFSYMMYCYVVCMRNEGVLLEKMSDEQLLECKRLSKRAVEIYFADEEG